MVQSTTLLAPGVRRETAKELNVLGVDELRTSMGKRIFKLLKREERRCHKRALLHAQMAPPVRQKPKLRWWSSTLIRMEPGSRRSQHTDPGPEDVVVMQTLTGSATTFFRCNKQTVNMVVQEGTLLIMSGAARKNWLHGVDNVRGCRWSMVHRYILE